MSRVVAFFSPVHAGATTFLLQTARRLANKEPHLRILVLDLNLLTPSVAFLFGLTDCAPAQGLTSLISQLVGERLSAATLGQALLTPARYSQIKILPGVLDLLLSEQLTPKAIQSLIGQARGLADLLLIDTTPVLQSAGCLPVLTEADRILLLTGPELSDRLHVRRHAQVLAAGRLASRISVIVTRAQRVSRRAVERDLELPVDALIPPNPDRKGRLLQGRRMQCFEVGLQAVTDLAYPKETAPNPSWLTRLRARFDSRKEAP